LSKKVSGSEKYRTEQQFEQRADPEAEAAEIVYDERAQTAQHEKGAGMQIS